VLNIVRTAINQSLATAGIDPVTVAMDDNGFVTISSPSYGSNSQISIGNVNGGYGIIFPGSADGVNFTNSATVGGTVDVQLAADITLNSNRVNGVFGQDPEAINNFSGYQVVLNIGPGGSGLPVIGDSFLIDFNRDGKSDNSNAIAMLKLSSKQILSKGNVHLRGAYNQVVEEIGILTSQSRLSQQAGESLLQQSQAALQSVAGVNLEEEAANLIRFEQHYNASAQLISIARDMFNILLDL
jgi:flagellar hook-associated protein 1 FlgK